MKEKDHNTEIDQSISEENQKFKNRRRTENKAKCLFFRDL